ncbi:hypothetical protein LguiA_015276 [Lonicera macranthoides]
MGEVPKLEFEARRQWPIEGPASEFIHSVNDKNNKYDINSYIWNFELIHHHPLDEPPFSFPPTSSPNPPSPTTILSTVAHVNSHTSRGSSSTIIYPDLDRRFQALRSKLNPATFSKSNLNPQLPNPPPSISSVPTDLNINSDYNPQGDYLFVQFTALKSSIL